MSPADSTLDVGDKAALCIRFGKRLGKLHVDLRFWLPDKKNAGRTFATRRGVHLPAAHLRKVIAALQRIDSQMVKDGYLTDDDPPKFNPNVYPANDF